MLRKRIQELQHYRRMGLVSAADIDKYEIDVAKRVSWRLNCCRAHNTDNDIRLKSKRHWGEISTPWSDSGLEAEDNPLPPSHDENQRLLEGTTEKPHRKQDRAHRVLVAWVPRVGKCVCFVSGV